MNRSENGAQKSCPYFLRDMQACGLYSEGIYLPPRVHVLSYCLTPSYKSCATFERYYMSENLRASEAARTPAGRRRFMRFSGNRRVLIRACNSLGVTTGEFEENARTVDYSQGGMRVIMESKIPEGSLVLFDFDEEFLIPRLQGIAELCWHRKHPDAPSQFEAGLSFKDHFSKAALAFELEP